MPRFAANFSFPFAHMDRLGYDGWVGCEYRPACGTVEGLWRMYGA